VLLAATYWLDIVWPVLVLAGIEHVRIDPGNTAFTPLDFFDYPWSHSLALSAAWSVLFALVFFREGRRAAVILGLLVFSHWVLDFVTHRPDLPLWPGSATMLGLGLWNSVPATIVIESAMFAAGVWIYALSTRPRDSVGVFSLWGLVFFLGVIYAANAFGPPPPSVTAIGIAGVAGATLFTVWSWWIDRHRTSA
jgi:membrane-bound metal-dependent hydrolase YbcI (DUF457 family)